MMKCEATQELVIGGFTEPQGPRVGLGALLELVITHPEKVLFPAAAAALRLAVVVVNDSTGMRGRRPARGRAALSQRR